MDFLRIVTDPGSAYHEDDLKGDRETWYHGFERGLAVGLNILLNMEDFEIESEIPVFQDILASIIKLVTDAYQQYAESSKAEALVSLLDEQFAEEGGDVP